MIRLRGVETLGEFRVRLSLTDGSVREVDLEPFLNGPAFEPLRADPALFKAVRVEEQLGTIVWPNGADIDPDVLIHGRTPAALEAPGQVSRGWTASPNEERELLDAIAGIERGETVSAREVLERLRAVEADSKEH